MTVSKDLNSKEREEVGGLFENDFGQRSLEPLVAACNRYELISTFEEVLPDHTPILEAGCGSGRWAIWYQRRGWDCIGTDWSAGLCAAAARTEPRAGFVAADLRALPFSNRHFGAVVSLGAIEHVREGPARILREFHRVLRPGGRLIVTVPHIGKARRAMRSAKDILAPIRNRIQPRQGARTIRKSLPPPGNPDAGRWIADFHQMPLSEPVFFQYYFTPAQLDQLLRESGFIVDRVWVDFRDEGILHTFGELAARYDALHNRVKFNLFGRCLRATLPLAWHGHMVVGIARKQDACN